LNWGLAVRFELPNPNLKMISPATKKKASAAADLEGRQALQRLDVIKFVAIGDTSHHRKTILP
jgi:hypothetical protein